MSARFGVQADQGYYYKDLEAIARQLRFKLCYAATTAIDGVKLFDDLNDLVLTSGGLSISVRTGVIGLRSEGQTRYDPQKEVMEILLSEKTYHNLELPGLIPTFAVY